MRAALDLAVRARTATSPEPEYEEGSTETSVSGNSPPESWEYNESSAEDEDSEFGSEIDDEDDPDRWYAEQHVNPDEMADMFEEHIREVADPDHPLNVAGSLQVYKSSQQKVNDSDENLMVDSDEKPSSSEIVHQKVFTRTHKRSLKDQVDLNWKFKQLHRKLGHMSESQIKRAFFEQRAIFPKGVSKDVIMYGHLGLCVDCKSGSMRMKNHGQTTIHSWKVLEKIAVDYKGPFRVKTGDKHYNGFYLFSDYTSNYIYPYLVKSKTELLFAIRKMLIKLHNKCGARMRLLQGDADSVLLSEEVKSFLLSNESDLQTSPPHYKSANGQIESDMKRLLNKSRTIMHENNAPPNLWGYAIRYSAMILNYSPIRGNDGMSPHEAVFGEKPDYSRLYPFYCPGVYFVHKEERADSAFPDYKAKACYFLGYLEESPMSFLVKDVKTGRVLVRDSCVFDPDPKDWTLKDHKRNEILREVSHDLFEGKDVDEAIQSDAEEDQELVPINGPPEPILPRLRELRESSQEKHKAAEKREAERALAKKKRVESTSANSLSISESSDELITANHVPYARLFNVKYGAFTKRPLMSDKEVWLSRVNEVLSLKLPPEPKTFDEAIAPDNPYREQWWEAILKECQVLTDFGCFRVAEEQHGRTMKTKWVFKVMMKNDMTYKFKARLVVCGYSQIYGIDYNETYSPTTPISTIFMLMHVGATLKLFTAIFDVTAAFLEGTNDFKQYCWLPKELGLDGLNKLRVEIIKSLYGEKQAPKIWSDLLHSILVKMGFHRCEVVPCLYIRGTPDSEDYMLVCVHVDDGYIISKLEGAIDKFIEDLMKEIHNATLYKPCKKYVGMEIIQDGDHVYVHQTSYIKSLNLLDIDNNCHPEVIPMSNTMDLKDSVANPPILNYPPYFLLLVLSDILLIEQDLMSW